MYVYVLSVAHSAQPVIGVYELMALAMMAAPGGVQWTQGEHHTIGVKGTTVYRIERMEVR